MRPFCQASENNKAAILDVLRIEFAEAQRVLEIGSGTGQHAAYFVPAMPWLSWQTSELQDNLDGIRAWLRSLPDDRAPAPLALDVSREPWPQTCFDAAYSANTAHIMHWPQVEAMFRGLGRCLADTAVIALYGPFRYQGRHTAPSNESFDRWLRSEDPGRGIRDVDDLDGLAAAEGFRRSADHAMPVNNRVLVWRRGPA